MLKKILFINWVKKILVNIVITSLNWFFFFFIEILISGSMKFFFLICPKIHFAIDLSNKLFDSLFYNITSIIYATDKQFYYYMFVKVRKLFITP